MAKKEEIKYHDRADVSVADVPSKLPVIPLRDVVVFPSMVYPVLIGRDSSLRAASHSWDQHRFVFLATQKNASVEDPGPDGLHSNGSVAKIVQIVKMPNGLMKVLVDGMFRATAKSIAYNGQFLEAEVEVTGQTVEMTQEIDALGRHSAALFAEYVHLNRNLAGEVLISYEKIADPFRRLYYIAANLTVGVDVRHKILQFEGIRDQLFELAKILTTELDVLRIEKDIDNKVHDSIQKAQKKFLLQEQIRVLQDELGGDDVLSPELEKLKKQIQAAKMPPEVKEKAMEEFTKLRKTPPQSPEFGVGRNYLDWMVNVPWYKRTKDNLDVRHVETILDEDHFGLEKPKQRILEHIAVLNLVKEMKGQILCFVGPPGVGKTSLGKSIARALGRKFVRISLGGVRDEAEIRGHRRTYIGSMPGKLIQSMKKAGVVNPVILMDEVDKMSTDFRGDPASALLEVLDPEQNISYNDHYLDVDYDLSRVMFITTANVRYNIPLPLQDRMEMIELPGYLDFDKTEIAKRHIVPKQLAEHGLKSAVVEITDEAIVRIIREYTREAGVRNLEREIASVCRKVAKEIVVARNKNGNGTKGAKLSKVLKGKKPAKGAKGAGDKKVIVDPKKIEEYLGVPRFRSRLADTRRRVGSVTGLAWTSVGGDILSVDVTIMDGPEKLTLTGQLGDVMKESAQAALSYIRSNAKSLGVPLHFSSKKEIHIHLPEGAIPKDGPSAGITMAMAMISAASNRPARPDVAMTGEITLRGSVLAIGGLNEKLLAAQRNGMRTVLIPKENEKDLPEIPARVKEGLKIVPIEKIEDAITWVFGK